MTREKGRCIVAAMFYLKELLIEEGYMDMELQYSPKNNIDVSTGFFNIDVTGVDKTMVIALVIEND